MNSHIFSQNLILMENKFSINKTLYAFSKSFKRIAWRYMLFCHTITFKKIVSYLSLL